VVDATVRTDSFSRMLFNWTLPGLVLLKSSSLVGDPPGCPGAGAEPTIATLGDCKALLARQA
jgi:hypothetical protein